MEKRFKGADHLDKMKKMCTQVMNGEISGESVMMNIMDVTGVLINMNHWLAVECLSDYESVRFIIHMPYLSIIVVVSYDSEKDEERVRYEVVRDSEIVAGSR